MSFSIQCFPSVFLPPSSVLLITYLPSFPRTPPTLHKPSSYLYTVWYNGRTVSHQPSRSCKRLFTFVIGLLGASFFARGNAANLIIISLVPAAEVIKMIKVPVWFSLSLSLSLSLSWGTGVQGMAGNRRLPRHWTGNREARPRRRGPGGYYGARWSGRPTGWRAGR